MRTWRSRAQQQGISLEEMERRRASVIPLQRANDPEDIAAMAVFLAGPGARNITGQSFNVDGGLIPGVNHRRQTDERRRPKQLILTGENPFLRLSQTDSGANFTTNASYWRIITCPAGPGHVLYLKSELTSDRWRIYSDNIAMARWLQSTVQGMLNAETGGSVDPGDRSVVLQGGRSTLLLDRGFVSA